MWQIIGSKWANNVEPRLRIYFGVVFIALGVYLLYFVN